VSPQPSLDLHAHVDADIDPAELVRLGVVFVATRTLDEADAATRRADEQTIWGVGCHPGLVGAQKAFEPGHFAELISRTAFVSEVGLDGKSRVPMKTQEKTLRSILDVLDGSPRITSLHSYQASERVIRALEVRPVRGAVLHWWLGDESQTRRALELGCFFSINASSVRRTDLLRIIPLDRILTETDHPFGDRRGGSGARPGLVTAVERALARHHGVTDPTIRSAVWSNLARLVAEAGCGGLLPRGVRRQLIAS
jgi:TatD DNase family protein